MSKEHPDNKSLRILTVANVPPDPNSGAAGTVWHTAEAMKGLGHHVQSVWSDELPQRIRHGNLHAWIEQPRNYRRAVAKHLRESRFDAIVISQPQAYLAAEMLRRQAGFGGVMINRSHGMELRADRVLGHWYRELGIPDGKFPQSMLTPFLRRRLQAQWQRCARACDGFVMPCDLDRQELLRRTAATDDAVRVIHHAVPDAFLAPDRPLMTAERCNRILHVGQQVFFKGTHILSRVLNQSLRESPKLTASCVTSKSSHHEFLSRIDADLRCRVRMLDWMEQTELIELYDTHGIFVFPSLYEGFGKAPLEAMTRGMAVVASDEGGMHDYVRNGENGYLCQRGDVDQFVARVRQLHASVSHCERLGLAARQSVASFSWKGCAEQWIHFIRQRLMIKTEQ